jgi:hypothetical protein
VEAISPADLDMMIAYAYEGMYRSSYIGQMVDFEQKLWKVSCLVNKMNAGILKKCASVERDSTRPYLIS